MTANGHSFGHMHEIKMSDLFTVIREIVKKEEKAKICFPNLAGEALN